MEINKKRITVATAKTHVSLRCGKRPRSPVKICGQTLEQKRGFRWFSGDDSDAVLFLRTSSKPIFLIWLLTFSRFRLPLYVFLYCTYVLVL